MAKISEIAIGGKIDVEGTIKSMEEPKVFNKFGKDLTLVNAMLEDDSGSIKLALWNDDVMKVSEGCKVKIVNGYCSEYKGEKNLSPGKFGKLEVCE